MSAVAPSATTAPRSRVTTLRSRAAAMVRGDDPPAGGPWGRGRIVLAFLVPIVLYLGGTGIRILHQPKLNFDEHIFLDVGRHILDTGLPLRAYAVTWPADALL